MMRLLLPYQLHALLLIAVSAVIHQIDDVDWENPNAKVWPAIRGKDPVHVPNALGVWSANTWNVTVDCPTAADDGDDKDDCPLEIEQMIDLAMDRFASFLEAFIPRSRSEHNDYPVNPTNATLFPKVGVQISLATLHLTLHDADESYALKIGLVDDWVEIKARTVYGALHGLTTLQQLLEFGWFVVPDSETADDEEPIFTIPLLSEPLVDIPAYMYRGLMIDTARHYLPVSLIEYTLEIMAAHKMNVLHWHMTDSQSWPYWSTRYPELATSASYCPTCIYTPNDIRYLQTVAQQQGIRVIPEFDLPGHSQGSYLLLLLLLLSCVFFLLFVLLFVHR
jgi:Glycosyl hydrolase family 20, catalytic domain/beta-acetyl hexosaminidase like